MLTGGCFENEPDAGGQETLSLPSTHLDLLPPGVTPARGRSCEAEMTELGWGQEKQPWEEKAHRSKPE